MSKGKAVIWVVSILVLGAAVWFGVNGWRGPARDTGTGGSRLWGPAPGAPEVTAYDADGAVTARECGFFVSPRRLVVHRHVFRGAKRLEVKTHDGRTFEITGVLAEDYNLDTILLMTDSLARADEVLKLASTEAQLGDNLTVVMPALEGAATGAGEVRVTEVAADKWAMRDFFFVEGDVPDEATGSPLVNTAGEVVGYGTFVVADNRPVKVVISSKVIERLMQRADRVSQRPFAAWVEKVGKDVKLPNVGRVGRLASWADRQEDYLACSKAWTEAEPSNVEAWINLSWAYRSLKRQEEATEAMETAVGLKGEAGSLGFELAWSYDQAGKHEEAIKAYREFIREHPEEAIPYDNLGLVYLHQDRYDEALAAFKNAVLLDNKFINARLNLSVAYSSLGQYDAAAAELVKAAEMAPDDAQVRLNLSDVYIKLGRYEDSMAESGKAIALEADNAKPYVNFAVACIMLGRQEEAAQRLVKAIELSPEYAIAHRDLALVYGNLKRYEDSAKEAAEAIRLDPEYTAAYIDLGLACRRLERWDEAVEAYTKAMALSPENSNAFEGRGYAYAALGKKDLAMKDYEVLKKLCPADAPSLLNEINKL